VIAGRVTIGTVLDFSGTELWNIAQIVGSGSNDNITGSAGNDVIAGGTGDDIVNGGAGDDVIVITGVSSSAYDIVNGGTGFDQIIGSEGDDTIRLWNYTGANTVERIDGGGGLNVIATRPTTSTTINLSGTELANIEKIVGGAAGDTLTGSAGNDVIEGAAANDMLSGGPGNDTLDGGTGNDRMTGGAGDDTYKVDSAADAVTEVPGEGMDSVTAALSYTLPANVEVLNLDGIAAINATGNTLANTLNGNSGANVLDGGAGADMLYGGAGDDIFAFRPGEAQGDVVLDFSGNGAAAGDSLRFTGFGTGATLTQNGATDYWTINYGGNAETIRLAGVTSLDASDYSFIP
jgi:Ca2+-binding RTX toxin-like protein